MWRNCGENKELNRVFLDFSTKTRVFRSGREVIDFGWKWSENGDRWGDVDNYGITNPFCG